MSIISFEAYTLSAFPGARIRGQISDRHKLQSLEKKKIEQLPFSRPKKIFSVDKGQ